MKLSCTNFKTEAMAKIRAHASALTRMATSTEPPVAGAANVGVVYKLDPTGNETLLHTLRGGADGAYPITCTAPRMARFTERRTKAAAEPTPA